MKHTLFITTLSCYLLLGNFNNVVAQKDSSLTKYNWSFKAHYIGGSALGKKSFRSFGLEANYNIHFRKSKKLSLQTGLGYYYRTLLFDTYTIPLTNGSVKNVYYVLINNSLEAPIRLQYTITQFSKHSNLQLFAGGAPIWVFIQRLEEKQLLNKTLQWQYQLNKPTNSFSFYDTDVYTRFPIGYFKTIVGVSYAFKNFGVSLEHNYFTQHKNSFYSKAGYLARNPRYNNLMLSLTISI